MRHSVIMKIGENWVYQYAPFEKPVMETTASPVEFNRALPEWEHTSKAVLIKPEDKAGFEKLIDLEKIHVGCPIPFKSVEIYPEGDKQYARFSDNPNKALSEPVKETFVATLPQHPNKTREIATETKPKKENNVVAELVLNVDEDGDVYLSFKSLIAPIDLETKLFNSFLKKAREKGVIITAPKIEDIPANTGAKDQFYKLKIKV